MELHHAGVLAPLGVSRELIVDERQGTRRVDDPLQLEREAARVSQLIGGVRGELERLMLARALAGAPRLLVVDGMFDRLAAPLREELLEATLLSPAREWTLVLVTQDETLAARCERVLRLVPARTES